MDEPKKQKFATALNCMDGRTQLPVIEFVKKASGVSHVDLITEQGMVKLLSELSDNDPLIQRIMEKLDISVTAHGSRVIAVAGHNVRLPVRVHITHGDAEIGAGSYRVDRGIADIDYRLLPGAAPGPSP